MSAPAPARFLCLCVLLSLSAFAQNKGPFFRPVQNYDSGVFGGATPVVVADINGDGKPDILLGIPTNSATVPSSVSVLLGNGDGTFQSAKTYSTGSYHLNGLAVADLNGDGLADLAVAQHDGVAVLLGNGDGTFRAPVQYLIGGNTPGTAAVAVADLNGDGIADLAVAVDAHAGVLLGNGDGTFGNVQTFYSGGDDPSAIAITDANHDGKPDLVIYDAIGWGNNSTVAVLLGDGTGSFQPVTNYDGGGWPGGSLAVADMNGDGNPDVVTVNTCVPDCGTSDVGVLVGNGDGTFQPIRNHNFTGGYLANSLAIADINRDGIPDVLVANTCNNHAVCDFGGVGLLLGRGDGTFLPATGYNVSLYGTQIAVMDVNGDGTPDVFVTTGTVGVLLSLFDTNTTLTSSLPQSAYGQAVTLTAKLGTNGPTAPTGTVLFMNGKTWLGTAPVVNNIASLTTTHLPAGTLSLTAVYRGDDLSTRSTSPVISQTVSTATTVTAIHSSLNPSAQGQPVRFTATVSSPTAKVIGTVTFSAGTTILGTVGLNSAGQASVVTSTLPTGRTQINAVYNGTANILGSRSAMAQTVN